MVNVNNRFAGAAWGCSGISFKTAFMQPENFSPKDSLALIDQMINQARNRVTENGFLYLLWGWIILFCSVGHFAMIRFTSIRNPEIIWAAAWVAVILQIIYMVRNKKKETVKTYSDTIIDYIWTSFGICMFIVSIAMSQEHGWRHLYPMYLMLYGIPTFLSGVVMRFLPLRVGGVFCWGLSVIAIYIGPLYALLLLGAAVIAAWIIPGYLLRRKYNQHYSSTTQS